MSRLGYALVFLATFASFPNVALADPPLPDRIDDESIVATVVGCWRTTELRINLQRQPRSRMRAVVSFGDTYEVIELRGQTQTYQVRFDPEEGSLVLMLPARSYAQRVIHFRHAEGNTLRALEFVIRANGEISAGAEFTLTRCASR